ncbi:thiosulfate sulfurtransferase GlpE [Aliiglaciecola sp. CAU 1673]|uniref:thiosulfate sulfurtransferase GlpE n=1 Tax=Aliiglaciecola sp. CAU 1673 TaxID=3032595 RepID=UPI0023DB2CA5|nr:thiosulfate sulfurtransferase GlpE [Aliiglaciecola sp. CAU 1673]MDF2179266.1 thiosulfate sulfurtransferase GlpE [Aliiglaciecola sp. CAU 1673]
MQNFKHINAAEAKERLESGSAVVADIRDGQSFLNGHIAGSVHLTNDNLSQFMQDTPQDKAVIVCCYHGISSQQAAQFLVQQGYQQVYSLDGGFEGWRLGFPFVTGND